MDPIILGGSSVNSGKSVALDTPPKKKKRVSFALPEDSGMTSSSRESLASTPPKAETLKVFKNEYSRFAPSTKEVIHTTACAEEVFNWCQSYAHAGTSLEQRLTSQLSQFISDPMRVRAIVLELLQDCVGLLDVSVTVSPHKTGHIEVKVSSWRHSEDEVLVGSPGRRIEWHDPAELAVIKKMIIRADKGADHRERNGVPVAWYPALKEAKEEEGSREVLNGTESVKVMSLTKEEQTTRWAVVYDTETGKEKVCWILTGNKETEAEDQKHFLDI